MIQFKPYPSIGNAADTAWMAQVRENVEIGTLFAVQEKVDGANVSFLCDDLDVRMARRTAILDPLEPFFGYQQVLERYSGHIYHIYNRLRLSYPEMTSVAVYGELFGGYYPHPDVAPDPVGWPVQKGIWYAPGHDFYAFDIYVFTKDGGFFLPVMEANALFFLGRGPPVRLEPLRRPPGRLPGLPARLPDSHPGRVRPPAHRREPLRRHRPQTARAHLSPRRFPRRGKGEEELLLNLGKSCNI